MKKSYREEWKGRNRPLKLASEKGWEEEGDSDNDEETRREERNEVVVKSDENGESVSEEDGKT